MKTPIDILKAYWRYDSFRPLQEEIIQSVLENKHTFALLPTGGGKSICYQIPALLKEGICVVISPLVALMHDQANRLKSMGIKTAVLSGGISYKDLDIMLDNCIYGGFKFLFLSPERLQQELVRERLKKMTLSLIAIDEAHCISQWGNDFRPAYKNIGFLRENFPKTPVLALTATATQEVIKDTINELNLENHTLFKGSFFRKNLAYSVREEEDKLYHIKLLLKTLRGNAIIYVRNRKATHSVSAYLNSFGFKSAFFHGGLPTPEKNKKLDDWTHERTPIMVATTAFGMGIDKANVYLVIHINLPESLESYYQEAGRAGRDDKPSNAIIIYNEQDKINLKNQFIKTLPKVEFLKFLYRKLSSFFQISYGEGAFTTHQFNFNAFCLHYNFNPTLVYNGINTLDRMGVLKLSQQFGQITKVQFISSPKNTLFYLEKDIRTSVIGKIILRLYSGIFESAANINLALIQSKTQQSQETIINTLKTLEQTGIISLSLSNTDASLTFIVPREDHKTINRIAKTVEKHNQKKKQQVALVLDYINNTKICKSVQLAHYLGEKSTVVCGICSVCVVPDLQLTKTDIEQLANQIKIVLKETALSSREIVENLNFTESKVLYVLNLLLEQNRLVINLKNQYQLN